MKEKQGKAKEKIIIKHNIKKKRMKNEEATERKQNEYKQEKERRN